MPQPLLIVDDDAGMCDVLSIDLGRAGFAVTAATSGEEALARLVEGEFVAVVTDLNMGSINGLELCERIRASHPDLPVIVITAFGSLETAVAAIRAGAYDFVTKPFDTDQLVLILNRALQLRALQDEVKRLRLKVATAGRFEGIVGESAAMKRVLDLVDRLADSDVSVLVTGETGTGKELIARALHDGSRRREGPFVPIHCGAVPETLLESELFGHVRGAFTDAKLPRKGLFMEADGGTVFLDEISTMPMSVQAKLLRAIQERKVRPVGSDKEVEFDVRFIAATNRELEQAVEEGTFREDLLYRINVVNIALPPLRMRGNDVLLLAQRFVDEFARASGKQIVGLSGTAAERLVSYSWPGNVRELRNCIERAVALARYDQITPEDLPDRIRTCTQGQTLVFGGDPGEFVPLHEVERRYILRVLDAVQGNKTLAAQILGLDRKTLYRKLDQYLPRQP
jgi:two-component system response regulator HydG